MTGELRRGVYAITDCVNLPFPSVLEVCRIVLDCGAVALQYRDKHAGTEERRERAQALHSLCCACSAPLIINDDPTLAAEVGAEGVHLGAEDPACRSARTLVGPQSSIGVSCYASIETARTAVADGANYVAFGAFFPTGTKLPRARPTPEILARAKAELSVPVVAIGGITPDNAGALLAAGADLLAVVGALFSAPDPAATMKEFARILTEHA